MALINPCKEIPNLWKSHALTLITAARIVEHRLSKEMRRDGIPMSPREAWVMMAVEEKPQNQGIVAQCLNINPNVMVRTVDKLEKKGLLSRVRKRRLVDLKLTPKGQATLTEMYKGWDRRSERIFYPLTLPEILEMDSLTIRLISGE